MLKKRLLTLMIIIGLTAATALSAQALSIVIDQAPASMSIVLENNTTYVPLRSFLVTVCPDAAVSWVNKEAVIRRPGLTITARPGNQYLNANGRMLYIENGVKLENGVTLVPVRVLAKALGASVSWNVSAGTVDVKRGSGTIQPGDSFYDADAVYWLSRIINAESGAEPLKGKIAVGNVILNRVSSPDFPNTIYGVIFDSRWGGQFEPVSNGTINNDPSAESILAAKLCLDGASVAGGSLFFLNPELSTSFWILQNRSLVAAIGSHQFYA